MWYDAGINHPKLEVDSSQPQLIWHYNVAENVCSQNLYIVIIITYIIISVIIISITYIILIVMF